MTSIQNVSALLQRIKTVLQSPEYLPVSFTVLCKILKLTAKEKSLAKKIIQELLEKKELSLEKSKISALKNRFPSLRGTLRMNPRGFGFVIPENKKKHPEDIFIPRHLTATAIDGDIVEVQILPSSKKDKGPEGKIIAITQRGKSQVGGIVQYISPSDGSYFIHSPFLGPSKQIKATYTKEKLQTGDRVSLKVLDWGGQNKPILAEVLQCIGSISDASLDVSAAAEEFSLRKDFPENVLKEVEKFGSKVLPKQFAERLDLRKWETFTIDPTTAKDFDDALSLSLDEEGNYFLGVHIADVAHYVKPETALDQEALQRCNSTYFPGACIPMLPEGLSNELCSLKPKVPRLCISILMTISPDGDVIKHEVQRTVIQSKHRFTYEEAKEVLDGKKTSKHKQALQNLVTLCLLLKKKRYERGSIDFALPEVVLDIDDRGNPTSYHIVEYDITHQLVEECMLKANEMAAKTLSAQGVSLIFRIHEEPEEQNLEDFYAQARLLGFSVAEKPSLQETQKLFEQIKGSPFAQQLSVAFIRSMKLASYSPENIGHFGLSLEHYCHFTSPIRRYPDLVIQRLLFQELPLDTDLEKIADLCSEKERISFKAEQTVKTLKKLRLLNLWHKNDPHRQYSCSITKIKPFGLFFELPPLGIEGFLHVADLAQDYFIYNEASKTLIGEHTGTCFRIGDEVHVQLKSVDLILLETKWLYHCEFKKNRPEKKRKKRKKSKRKS